MQRGMHQKTVLRHRAPGQVFIERQGETGRKQPEKTTAEKLLVVRIVRLELTRISPLASKTSVSTNSTIPALQPASHN
jgi:hypothetical protein